MSNELNPPAFTLDYEMKVWRGLIKQDLEGTYANAKQHLNTQELVALHTQMHQTKYHAGRFSLGEIMNIPKPDATENSGIL